METTTNRRASVEALKPIAYRASQGISWSPEQQGTVAKRLRKQPAKPPRTNTRGNARYL